MLQRLRLAFSTFDWPLFFAALLLLAVSNVILYSVAVGREGGDLGVFYKQLIITGFGLSGLLVLSLVNTRLWETTSRWIYVGMIAILAATLLFGSTVHGTRGWIGFGSLRFQPVELAKLASILVLAAFFSRRARELDRLPNLLQSLALVGGFIGCVLLQPDFGSAAVIGAVWAGLVLTIGIRRRVFLGLIIAGAVSFTLAWVFLFKPYQQERILTFFSPAADTAASYNVRQATIAVGSGGLFGRGLGEGSQSQLRFLPEAETDFIFAVVGEELGFVGVALVLGLYVIIFYRFFLLLQRCHDWFASYIVLGATFLFGIEIFMNAGMAMGLFPVVGIPFPLLSAGGSALLVHLLLLGIVESVARSERERGYGLSVATR